jgi:hypothetical protein
MGIDRWESEHRAYRPDRPSSAEVSDDDRLLDLPQDLPIQPATKPRRQPKTSLSKNSLSKTSPQD